MDELEQSGPQRPRGPPGSLTRSPESRWGSGWEVEVGSGFRSRLLLSWLITCLPLLATTPQSSEVKSKSPLEPLFSLLYSPNDCSSGLIQGYQSVEKAGWLQDQVSGHPDQSDENRMVAESWVLILTSAQKEMKEKKERKKERSLNLSLSLNFEKREGGVQMGTNLVLLLLIFFTTHSLFSSSWSMNWYHSLLHTRTHTYKVDSFVHCHTHTHTRQR